MMSFPKKTLCRWRVSEIFIVDFEEICPVFIVDFEQGNNGWDNDSQDIYKT